MNTFRTAVISLVGGTAFGFLIHGSGNTTQIVPDVITLDALCKEIADQEWVQRKIFHDYDALPLPECQTAQPSTTANGEEGGTPGWNDLAERVRHFLASRFGPKVVSSDQPKSIASTR